MLCIEGQHALRESLFAHHSSPTPYRGIWSQDGNQGGAEVGNQGGAELGNQGGANSDDFKNWQLRESQRDDTSTSSGVPASASTTLQ